MTERSGQAPKAVYWEHFLEISMDPWQQWIGWVVSQHSGLTNGNGL